jgi:hypothetical protein
MSLSGSSYSQHLGRETLDADATGLPKPGAGPCRGVVVGVVVVVVG